MGRIAHHVDEQQLCDISMSKLIVILLTASIPDHKPFSLCVQTPLAPNKKEFKIKVVEWRARVLKLYMIMCCDSLVESMLIKNFLSAP